MGDVSQHTARRGREWLVLGLLISGIVIAVAILLKWGWTANENAQRLSVTGTAAMVEANTLATAHAESQTNAEEQKVATERQSQISLARQLATQAQFVLATEDSRQMTAILLAIQSMRVFPTGDASQILQSSTLSAPESVMTHEDQVESVDFSFDGNCVVSGSRDKSARVWDAVTGREIARMVHEGGINSVEFVPHGSYVVSGGCDEASSDLISCVQGSARVWDALSGREIARMTHDDRVFFANFSPNGRLVVSGGCSRPYGLYLPCADQTIRVWKAFTGDEIARFMLQEHVTAAIFSPDGKYVLSSGCDGQDGMGSCTGGSIRVWEISSGREISRMVHEGEITSAAFSPDGNYVVSGSSDKTARVWESSTGKEIARKTFEAVVSSVAFNADGHFVVVGSYDGTALVWMPLFEREVTRVTHSSSVAFISLG